MSVTISGNNPPRSATLQIPLNRPTRRGSRQYSTQNTMRTGLLVMLLIGFGCAGPQGPQTRNVPESHGDATCPSRQVSPEKEHAIQKRCSSVSAGLSTAGKALSGAVTALRMPNL